MKKHESYKIFYTVAIHGSISKAAEALYISQPAITKSIKKLESELNIPIYLQDERLSTKSATDILIQGKIEGIDFENEESIG